MCLNSYFKVVNVVRCSNLVQLYEPLLPSTLWLNIYTDNTFSYIWAKIVNRLYIHRLDREFQTVGIIRKLFWSNPNILGEHQWTFLYIEELKNHL